MEDKISMNQFD